MNPRLQGASLRSSVLFLACSLATALCGPLASADGVRHARLSRADLVYLRHESQMLSLGFSPPPVAQLAPRSSRAPAVTPVPSRSGSAVIHSEDSAARRDAVVHGLERSGTVRRCWTAHLMRFPHTESRRLPVALHVDADGRVTAIDVRDADAPELAACIARAFVSPIGPGEPLVAETTVSLDRAD